MNHFHFFYYWHQNQKSTLINSILPQLPQKKATFRAPKAQSPKPKAVIFVVRSFSIDSGVQVTAASCYDWKDFSTSHPRYENVDSIDDQLSNAAQSNLDVLMEKMQRMHYDGQIVMTDAMGFGLPCRRKRVYIMFINLHNPKLDLNLQPLARVWSSFRRCVTSCLRSPPCASEILEDAKSEAAMAWLYALQWKQVNSKSKKKPAPGKGWIEQHMKFADSLNIRWGLAADAELACNPWFALLTEREADVLKLDRAAAPQAGFRNLSQSVNRASTVTLQESGKHLAPTMLPGQLLWCDLLKPPRPLMGREALLFQGFPVPQFLDQKDRDYEASEALMQELAGNAMAVPVVLATLQSLIASVWLKPPQKPASDQNVQEALSALSLLMASEASCS